MPLVLAPSLRLSDPQPSLSVYKLTARRQSATEPWTPVIKLSDGLQAHRSWHSQHIRLLLRCRQFAPAGIYDLRCLVTKSRSKATVVDLIDPYSTHNLEELLASYGKAGREAASA